MLIRNWYQASTEEIQQEIHSIEIAISTMTLEAERFEATLPHEEGYRLQQQLASARRVAIKHKRELLDKLRAILHERTT